MSKILVSGAAGFIGSHLCAELLKRGHKVVGFDNLSSGKIENLPDGVTLVEKDIRDYNSLSNAFKGVDYVFHLAAIPQVMYSIDNPYETNDVNINGTVNVLQAAHEHNIKKVVFASSSAIYGDSMTPTWENTRSEPQNPYAVQKLTGEMYCKLYTELYNLPTIALRFFNVYGPRQNPESSYAGVIARFFKATLWKKPLPIIGSGTQSRDFVHVSDVVEALIKAMESDVEGIEINIGSGHSTSVLELAEIFGGEIEFLPDRNEVKHTLADISLANSLLNWYPKVSLEQGIEDLLHHGY